MCTGLKHLYELFDLILIIVLWVRYYYYLHYTDGKKKKRVTKISAYLKAKWIVKPAQSDPRQCSVLTWKIIFLMLTEMRFPPLQPIIVIHPSSNMKDFYPLWRKYSNSFFLLGGMYLADSEVFQWDGSGTQTTVEPAWLKIQWEADLSGLDYGIRLVWLKWGVSR